MILLFSGGLDSYIAWHYLDKPQTVYFNLNTMYSTKELNVVRQLIPDTIVEYCIDFNSREEQPSAYIPYRNLHLALLANKYADTIVIAGVRDDNVNDKNEAIFNMFSQLMSHMMDKPIKVVSPFWDMTKAEVVKWFIINGGTKEQLLSTISCYSSIYEKECGRCNACYRKMCALAENEIYIPFTNTKLMEEYYLKAKAGFYVPERNQSIIKQSLKVHPEWR